MTHAKTTNYGRTRISDYGKSISEPGKPVPQKKKFENPLTYSGYKYCTHPGCVNRAICASHDKITGAAIPGQLCVQHWQVEYEKTHTEPSSGGRMTKDGRFVKAPVRKGAVGNAVKEYIDKVGIDNIDFEAMKDVVLSVKADSKFNKNHFSWYRNDYKKKHLSNQPDNTSRPKKTKKSKRVRRKKG